MSPFLRRRNVSSGSASSETSNADASVRRPISPRKVNANSYCGRHSDEFLFKGLGDIWRSVIKK